MSMFSFVWFRYPLRCWSSWWWPLRRWWKAGGQRRVEAACPWNAKLLDKASCLVLKHVQKTAATTAETSVAVLCYAVLWALNQLINSEACCLLIPTRHIETSNATSFSSLPSRYLPPGSIKLLWHQMLQDKGHPNVSQLGISRFPWQRFAQICRDWFTVENHGALADSVPRAIWHGGQSVKHKWTCTVS